jgi:hypothetical protein
MSEQLKSLLEYKANKGMQTTPFALVCPLWLRRDGFANGVV